jgi:predicted PurR-regulated permease PerM
MPFAVMGVVLFAQLIDNIAVIPSVIASAVNLHPITVLLGVIIFGYMFGFIGMLLAIPVLSSAKIVFLGLINGLSGHIESRKHSIQ